MQQRKQEAKGIVKAVIVSYKMLLSRKRTRSGAT